MDEHIKRYRVGGTYEILGHVCDCPHCKGHNKLRSASIWIEAETASEALRWAIYAIAQVDGLSTEEIKWVDGPHAFAVRTLEPGAVVHTLLENHPADPAIFLPLNDV